MPVTHDICRYTGKKILRPSLKLIGAKTKIRDLLYPHFPTHDVYYEPFLGTGGVLIGKQRSEREIVGDLNEYLINYYEVMRKQPADFYAHMKLNHDCMCVQYEIGEDYAADLFNEWKKQVVDCADYPVMRAALFYLITKHGWNGLWRLNQDGECNTPWGQAVDGRGIFDEYWMNEVHKRIQGVEFFHGRYGAMMCAAWSQAEQGSNCFMFIDPPYHDCSTTYNGEFFSDEDFLDMRSMLRDAPFKWLLTINDDQFIRDLFEGYSMISHSVFYSCNIKGSERKKQPELLIANYDLDPLPPVHQLSLFG